MATKICKGCGIEKDLEEFHLSPTNKMGRHPYCKECRNWNHRSGQSKQKELELKDLRSRGLKRCPSCKEIKPVTEFPSSKNRPDGLHPYCFVCSRSKGLEYVRRPEVKQHKKERESTREFLDNLAEYRRGSEKYQTRVKKYQSLPKYKEYATEYRKRDYVKVRRYLSTRIWKELSLYKKTKKSSYDEYLGCDIEFFMGYLTSLFTEGMNWDNHGRGSDKWHVDHIVACAEFDMNDDDEVKKCFHYSNQRPLWEPENLRKNSKNKEGVRIFKRFKK